MPFQPGTSGNPNGRPHGARTRRKADLEQFHADICARLCTEPREATFSAHDLLVAIYSHPSLPVELRFDAAKAALRVEKPALMATSVTGDVNLHLSVAEQLDRARARRLTLVSGTDRAIAEAAATILPAAQMEAA